MLALTRHSIADRLRRPLRGNPGPLTPSGEHAVLTALEQGRLDDARAALAEPAAHKLGDDFVRLVCRLLVSSETPKDNESSTFKRYEVDVPMHIWHEIARLARVEGRSIRRVLTDYLLRGWDEAQIARQEALDARRALRDELAAVRTECQHLREALRNARRN